MPAMCQILLEDVVSAHPQGAHSCGSIKTGAILASWDTREVFLEGRLELGLE